MQAVAEQIRINKYEAYKDSREFWIGDIPAHWEMRKLKHLFYEKKHTANPSLSCGSISFGKVVTKDDEKIPISTRASYQEVLSGEFLINPLNLNYDLISLRIALSYIDVVVSPGYIVLKNAVDINKEYFKYLLHRYDVAYMKLLGSGVRQTISFAHIADSLLVIPPLAEQAAISDFLNRKTAQIDKAVAQKERLIELLNERRQVLIHKAVTRGLDPHVKMKDSGVEWIGEVPEHWDVEKLKFHFNLLSGGTPSKDRADFWGGDIPWVSPKDMKSDWISKTEDYTTSAGLEQMNGKVLPKGTLLMVVRSGILQRRIPVAIAKVELSINQDIKAFVRTGRIESTFLFYFIYGCDNYLRNEWVKQVATVESIEVPIMNNSPILVPPAEEQIEIVNHILEIETKVAKALRSNSFEVDKLKEYKATLINAAVTGRIKVS